MTQTRSSLSQTSRHNVDHDEACLQGFSLKLNKNYSNLFPERNRLLRFDSIMIRNNDHSWKGIPRWLHFLECPPNKRAFFASFYFCYERHFFPTFFLFVFAVPVRSSVSMCERWGTCAEAWRMRAWAHVYATYFLPQPQHRDEPAQLSCFREQPSKLSIPRSSPFFTLFVVLLF